MTGPPTGERLAALRAAGVDPTPPWFGACADVTRVLADAADAAPGRASGPEVRCAGRAVLVRDHGGVVFLVLAQGVDRVQVVAERSALGPEAACLLRRLHRGDVVGVTGHAGRSRTGEPSLLATDLRLLAACLRPPPAKHRGPTNPEVRVRERELDLVANPESQRTFRARAAATWALRRTLHDAGYLEVETPVFANEAGGATARPFVTHHHALGCDLYLRIAPELFLKRLVVGGFDRVFELGRVFRNEGVDSTHNPEFTMLEVYRSPADYRDMMDLAQELVVAAARAVVGGTVVEVAGRPVDLGAPWRRVAMVDLVEEVTGRRIEPAAGVGAAREALDALGLPWEESWGAGRCLVEAFDELVEQTLVEPTIVMDHPVETSPLARRHRDDPTLTERFEVVVGGAELANAYSELTDPVDQRSRFGAEELRRDAGDAEAGGVDEAYLRALELGLPPTGGLGIGVDRLVMLLTGRRTIRDVILFPSMRPEPGTGAGAAGSAASIIPTQPPPTAVHPGAPVAFVRLSGLVRVVAVLTTVVGVLTMLSAIPALGIRTFLLDQLVTPLPAALGNNLVAAGLGLCMVLLSGQLLRGKRRAWNLALALFVLSAVLSLVRGGELVALVTSTAMVLTLLLTRREFTGLEDPPSVSRVVLLVPRYLAVVYLFGLVALWANRNRVTPGFTWARSLEAVTVGLFGLDPSYTYRGFFARWFPWALAMLGLIGLLLLLWLLLRPAVRTGSGEGRRQAQDLVARYGWDTLAPFALRGDKSWFFSSDGRAMIAYGYLGGFALGSGDPIGDDASIPLVVDEFIEHCRRHGWQPAFLAAREVDVPFYAERGFRDFYLGDEAVLDCRTFDLDAPGMGSVRQSVRRVERTHRFELLTEAEAGPALAEQLNSVSRAWRGDEDERGYTMAMSTDVGSTDPTRLLAVAWECGEGGERPVGFLRMVPTGGPHSPYGAGCTLDLMRRLPDAANGLTEFLIARSVAELRERGVVRLSLNFAAFARLLDDDVQHTRADRLLRRVVDLVNPYYQIRSLREFNEKFDPVWQPRVLIYADPADLPKVGLRYAWLEGFLTLPLLGRLLTGGSRAEAGHPGSGSTTVR